MTGFAWAPIDKEGNRLNPVLQMMAMLSSILAHLDKLGAGTSTSSVSCRV